MLISGRKKPLSPHKRLNFVKRRQGTMAWKTFCCCSLRSLGRSIFLDKNDTKSLPLRYEILFDSKGKLCYSLPVGRVSYSSWICHLFCPTACISRFFAKSFQCDRHPSSSAQCHTA